MDWVKQRKSPPGQDLVKNHFVVNGGQSTLLKQFLSVKIDRTSIEEDTVYFALSILFKLLSASPNSIFPNCFAVSSCMLGSR